MEDRWHFIREVSKLAVAVVESRKDGDTPDEMPETLRLLRNILSSPLFSEENAPKRIQAEIESMSPEEMRKRTGEVASNPLENSVVAVSQNMLKEELEEVGLAGPRIFTSSQILSDQLPN